MTKTPQPGAARAELAANWRLVLACMVGFDLSLSGIPFYTMGVFVDPLAAAFGWKVSAIQFGLTASYLTTVITLPAVAWIADRVGVRRVALASTALFGVAFMALALQPGVLGLFYLNWFLISLFGTGTLAVTWTRALTRRLFAARGLGLGLSLMGTGVVGIFGPTLAKAVVQAAGWRAAYVALGALPLLVALPIAWLFFHDVVGESPRAPKPLPAPLRNGRLWLLAAAFFLTAKGVTGLVPNLIKILNADGLSRDAAVSAAGLIGVFVIAGRGVCGALLDRFWPPGVAALFIAGTIAAAALLASHTGHPWVAALAAALLGLTVGAEFDLMPYLVARYLPPDRYTASLAIISACFYVGAAASGPGLALAYDRSGSYAAGLWTSIALSTASIAVLLALGIRSRRIVGVVPPR